MPRNNRIFYAVQSASIARNGSNSFTAIHGLQSVGITTKFNLEQLFEIGQISIYQNIENIPDVEVTAEKCLDGYPLIYHLATYPSTSATLVGRSTTRCIFGLSIYGDTNLSASGTPIAQCTSSGMFVSSLAYNFQIEGNSSEQVTLVGNNKIWSNTYTSPAFNNADVPAAAEGVNRRQHVTMGACDTSATTPTACILPLDIPGISASGTNNVNADGYYDVHVQSIKVSSDLGRTPLFELGRKGPFFRFVQFPTQVKCDIEILAITGDNVSAAEEGNNLTNRRIFIRTSEGTKIDLGSQNKLDTITYGGANAGTNGGNATMTFSYITFSDFTVTHPQDPSGL